MAPGGAAGSDAALPSIESMAFCSKLVMGLIDLLRVTGGDYRFARRSAIELNCRMRGFLQEDRLLDQLPEVLVGDRRRRHAGERGELVDHPSDVADMADDGVGADPEGLRVALDLGQVLLLDALGGELDRGQRVLDLVGDPPGDVRPGRLALSRQQLGDVVEGDDIAVDSALPLLGGGPGEQRAQGPFGRGERDLALADAAGTPHDRVQEVGELGQDRAELLAQQGLRVAAQQLAGGEVQVVDPAPTVEADDAGRDPGQDCLNEAAPVVELPVGVEQLPGAGSAARRSCG